MSQLNFFDPNPAENRVPRVHAAGPDTERQASKSVYPNSGGTRAKVLELLEALGEAGATDYEIGLQLRILRTSAGKRRKELQEMGYAQNTGKRRLTDTGCSAVVWSITGAGKRAARRSA